MKKLIVLLSLTPALMAVENSAFSLKAEVDALVAEINAVEKEADKLGGVGPKSILVGVVDGARESEFPAMTLSTALTAFFTQEPMKTIAEKIAITASDNGQWLYCEKANMTEAACELNQAIKRAGPNPENNPEVVAQIVQFNECIQISRLSDEECKEVLKQGQIEFCDLLLEKLK